MDNSKLVENIRTLCKRNNVSISRLESDLFLSPGLISRWSRNTPTLDKVMEVAQYFGVSIDELVGRSGNTMDFNNINNIERFLILLYNRSLTAETNWEILNPQDPPEDIPCTALSGISSNNSCDCYYTSYINGFFLLTATHRPDEDLLSLYILPDIYSRVERVLCDTERLMPLYEYLSRRFSRQMNHIKTNNLINAYLQDTGKLEETDTSFEKITPLRTVNEASSY